MMRTNLLIYMTSFFQIKFYPKINKAISVVFAFIRSVFCNLCKSYCIAQNHLIYTIKHNFSWSLF